MTTSSTCANLAQVADNGKAYNYKFYGLKAVIAVGYKVNSQAAVEFRHHETNLILFLIRIHDREKHYRNLSKCDILCQLRKNDFGIILN